jgi:hypothetical protein
MAQRSLRFAITDGAGKRGATWKLWTEAGGGQSDVYLACRELGGDLKASLHESGKWHFAFSERTFEEKVEGAISSLDTRFVEKWLRPQAPRAGITLAFRIVTPWSAITSPLGDETVGDIVWMPNAPENRATEIDIFLLAKGARPDSWPGQRSMNTALIGSLPLKNGETACAVHWVIDLPDLSRLGTRSGQFFRGKTREDLKTEGLRALVFGNEPDGSRVIHDCAVRGPQRPHSGSD